jgi:hypothetical protein
MVDAFGGFKATQECRNASKQTLLGKMSLSEKS